MRAAGRYCACAATAAILVAFAGCERAAPPLRLVTPKSPVEHEIASSFADFIGTNSRFEVALLGEALTDELALEELANGDADLAIVSNNTRFHPQIATVMPLYPAVLHIGYRKGRSAASPRELLQDATIFAGSPGSASRRMFERIVERLDLDASGLSFVEAFDDDPQVFAVFAPISPDQRDRAEGFSLFSMGSPDDIGRGSPVDAARLLNPQLSPFVIPAGTYGAATPEPVLTLAVDMLLVARSDLPAPVVFDLVEELLRLRPALAASQPTLYRRVTDELDASSSTFALHPGLVDYLQRDEPTVYERYSGLAEVLVTASVAVVSGLFAATRIIRRRRKNRIDTFYTAVWNIRRNALAGSASDDHRVAIRQIRRLQEQAFELLVDEQLAADESFRIFITLSSDVLEELGRIAASGRDA